MATVPGSNPSPKVSTNIVPPSGGSSKQRRVKGYSSRGSEDLTAPATVGEPEVVQDRINRSVAGVMLHRQLKKNKSTGIKGWK